jgi:hypothetical protein
LDEAIRKLRDLGDASERMRQVSALLATRQEEIVELSRIRRETLEDLRKQGLSQTDIAALAGVSRGRIGQLAKAGPAPERAFLGDGRLAIAVGLKESTKGEPVVAKETMVAFHRLSDLAASHQLDCEVEQVPPPGLLELNRENLIVLAGPRLFPMVGQILQGDPNLRFDQDEDDWFLRDLRTGETYQAPRDAGGPPHDFGYLGRLPRPDGHGSFLVVGGLHATGTQGVIAYLETALGYLYSEVKTRRFSMIVTCEYDPQTLQVTSAKQISPIYTRS